MVLAKDLHEKIQKMQLQIEGSKRLAFIEKELIETNKCISALIDKLEGKQPDDKLQKIKNIAEASDNVEVVDYTKPEQEEGEEHDDTDQDVDEEQDDDPEPDDEDDEDDEDDDDYEEEQETEEQIDARQECQFKDIYLSEQLHLKTSLDSMAGYNEAKEKQIADIMKAHSRDETYPFTFDNGEGGIDEIFASNYNPIIKRLIYFTNKYNPEYKIAYLELKFKDKNKYDQLKAILIQLLKTHEKLLNGTYPNQQKKYSYSISKTLFLFKVRRPYFIENLVNHYQKLSKLKSDRFN